MVLSNEFSVPLLGPVRAAIQSFSLKKTTFARCPIPEVPLLVQPHSFLNRLQQ
jgi:hypothetical protein